MIYQFGPFALNPELRSLYRGREPVVLPAKCLEALVVLVRHRGLVVIKDELMAALWPDTAVEEANLTQNVSTLRKALGDDPKQHRYIATVSGRGYSFVAAVTEVQGPESPSLMTGTGSPHTRPHRHLWTGALRAVAMLPSKPEKGLQWPRVRQLLPALATAAVAFSLFAVSQHSHWFGRSAFEGITSVAVLPLENLSGDKEQEYFADGMTDELITELSKIRALRVISRTSVMRYRGAKKPLPEIARELNVDAVVEGTLLRAGERVRITAQVIRAVPEMHLWSESYERDLRNLLDLQGEVARAIAGEIRIKLTSQERAGLSSSRPVDPVAHENYLRGNYFWNKRTEQDLQKSIEYFNRAVQKDPSYALAYAGFANAYNSLGIYAHLRPQNMYPKARAAALKALALDDTLAEAHAALGLYDSVFKWDQPGSDQEFRRAIQLNPGYSPAHIWRGETLTTMQRHGEALDELDRARELDPISLNASDQRGWVLYMARRYDEAIEQIRKTIELEPRSAHAHCWLGKAYLQKGMFQEGLSELRESATLPGGDSPLLAPWLGYAYAVSGKRAQAFDVIKNLKAQQQNSFGSPFGIAVVYCGLREKEQALAWLEKACQERDPQFPAIANEPPLDPLRSDRHFADLVRRSTLPP